MKTFKCECNNEIIINTYYTVQIDNGNALYNLKILICKKCGSLYLNRNHTFYNLSDILSITPEEKRQVELYFRGMLRERMRFFTMCRDSPIITKNNMIIIDSILFAINKYFKKVSNKCPYYNKNMNLFHCVHPFRTIDTKFKSAMCYKEKNGNIKKYTKKCAEFCPELQNTFNKINISDNYDDEINPYYNLNASKKPVLKRKCPYTNYTCNNPHKPYNNILCYKYLKCTNNIDHLYNKWCHLFKNIKNGDINE